jgi:DNA-binding response OmpR family regulator
MTSDSGLDPNSVINLSKANVLLVDDSPFALRLMAQIMMGISARKVYECQSSDEAQDLLKTVPIDLVLIHCDLPDMDGYDLVRWMRRSDIDTNAFTSAIMISGHTKAHKVTKARDCGANFIIAQPFSPATLLERIVWIARDTRSFLETDDYVGPDRRFKTIDPPNCIDRRAQRGPSIATTLASMGGDA